MRHRNRNENGREGLGFGLLLISLGVLFLLGQFGVIELREFWKWWPLWTIGWGLVQIWGLQSSQRVGGGITLVLCGVWFLIAQMEWYGLTWSNSWPLAFVAIGTGMVLRVAIGPWFLAREARAAQAAKEASEGGPLHG